MPIHPSIHPSLQRQHHPTNHPTPQLPSKPSAQTLPPERSQSQSAFKSNTRLYPVFDSPQPGRDGTIEMIINPITTSSRHRGPKWLSIAPQTSANAERGPGEQASPFRYVEGGTGRGVSARERMPRRISRRYSKHAFGTKRLIWGHRMPIDEAVNVVGKPGFGAAAVNVFGCGEGLRCYGSELCGWLSLTGLEYLPV